MVADGNGSCCRAVDLAVEDEIMPDAPERKRDVPTTETDAPNISTENQPKGSARRPSDTLDRVPERDPDSGAPIPSNYDPKTMTRVGEEQDTRAGREGAGRR
jgi:hypothetical protein